MKIVQKADGETDQETDCVYSSLYINLFNEIDKNFIFK